MRIVMHVDMDAFYAAVEERDNPSLKGKPIVIGADPKGGKGRGVVSTSSYEARKFGIRSGMPISIAYRKNPNAIFLPVNMRKYIAVSNAIMEILKVYSDAYGHAVHGLPGGQSFHPGMSGSHFEQVSIDEAFLEIDSDFSQAREIANKIKQDVFEKEKLTCSIGVAVNKLVAKIASDYKKPDGLTVVKNGEETSFLSILSVRKIPGIGPKTEAVLKSRGVETIRQLRSTPLFALQEWFGKKGGERLHEASKGIDESPLEDEREPKSAGAEVTFEKDTDDKTEIYGTLAKMCREVVKSLKGQGFKTVVIKVRYQGFETHTSQSSTKRFMKEYEEALDIAKRLIEPYLQKERKIRLIGFRVVNLESLDS